MLVTRHDIGINDAIAKDIPDKKTGKEKPSVRGLVCKGLFNEFSRTLSVEP